MSDIQNETEEWRAIPGYEGRYEVSNYGRVRGWRDWHKGQRVLPRHLSSRISKRGYIDYRLVKDGMVKNYFAHRLVMMAFVGPSGLDVNHKNGIKTDNRLANLEYISKEGNLRHARDVLGKYWGKKGESHPAAKLSAEQVEQIRSAANADKNNKELAAIFGVDRRQIGRIRRGERW